MVAAIGRSVQNDKIRGAGDVLMDGWMDATSGRHRCICEPEGLEGEVAAQRKYAGLGWRAVNKWETGEPADAEIGSIRGLDRSAAGAVGTGRNSEVAAGAGGSAKVSMIPRYRLRAALMNTMTGRRRMTR